MRIRGLAFWRCVIWLLKKDGGVSVAKGKYEYWLTPEGLVLLEGWARDGLTDEQIAHNMGINRATLYRWKEKHCDICNALKKGKTVIDRQVENALLKRALGFSYTEVTKERIIDTGQKKRHKGESKLTEREWEFAVKYFNGRCAYCGEYISDPTKDHVKPLHDGGTLTRDNVIPCCKKCNSSKKDNEMLSWYQKQPFYSKDRVQKIFDYIEFVVSLNEQEEERNTGGLVVTKEVTKEVIPDVTAQIYWLKNRKPGDWRDKREPEDTTAIDRLDRILAGLKETAEKEQNGAL